VSARVLEDRVALITGAGRGIGAAIARAYGREGARVVVNFYRSAAAADEVVAAIRAGGGEAAAVRADVTDADAVRNMVARALEAYGRIDVLVNNAGILNQAPLDAMSDAVWDEMIAVNLKSVFLCTRAVLPHMLARGAGRIINMSSTLGQKGISGCVHYATTKAAIIGFTKALAREVGPKGILVNAIAPGPVETDLLGPISDEYRRKTSRAFALRRLGSPDDIAPTAVFLASDAARFYAGQTLGPNGGDVMV
jgi:3-oxoacyl-[acyl-carrier protein] reductase